MTKTAPDRLLDAMLQNQQKELERYQAILAPLFNPQGIDVFQFACALLRVGGMQDAGWDPLEESERIPQHTARPPMFRQKSMS